VSLSAVTSSISLKVQMASALDETTKGAQVPLEHLHRGVEIAGVNPIFTPRGKTYAPLGGVNPELDLLRV
jgi:hypothetical protein